MNAVVVGPALRPGSGIFIEELARAVRRRNIHVPMREASLSSDDSSHADW